MISITPLRDSHHDAVLALSLTPAQIQFSQSPHGFIEEADSQLDYYVITYQQKVVGFFKLDKHYHLTLGQQALNQLGLRTFVIGCQFQRKGFATDALALLPDFIKQHYPNVKSLFLTVNCLNQSAYHCYLKAGFIDTEQLYLKGEYGAQHILSRTIAL